MFVSLEVLLSIPLYVLTAFDRPPPLVAEAGMKYFVLGAFSSALFLYGVALTYGATGTTSLTGIAEYLSQNTLFEQGTLLAGFALLLVGLGFKVAAVPFHMWTPDVYQGAPTPITAFMAAATKAAAFAALLRVFGVAFHCTLPTGDRPWECSRACRSSGQRRRGRADRREAHARYSSIAPRATSSWASTPHVGGREAALIYLFVYAFMRSARSRLDARDPRGDDQHSLDD